MEGTFNGTAQETNFKFCQHCGSKIPHDAVVCTACGRQVEKLKQEQASNPNVIINNSNSNVNSNYNVRLREKNKWVALILCFFLGIVGAHKFYEGKILLGIVYIFTAGLFGIGLLIDFFSLLFKPNPYFV
ncbi:MAG: TM2 domain-containing protein [Carnobacterium sp.]